MSRVDWVSSNRSQSVFNSSRIRASDWFYCLRLRTSDCEPSGSCATTRTTMKNASTERKWKKTRKSLRLNWLHHIYVTGALVTRRLQSTKRPHSRIFHFREHSLHYIYFQHDLCLFLFFRCLFFNALFHDIVLHRNLSITSYFQQKYTNQLIILVGPIMTGFCNKLLNNLIKWVWIMISKTRIDCMSNEHRAIRGSTTI